jgi:putative hydrolase of the HAD superfamily
MTPPPWSPRLVIFDVFNTLVLPAPGREKTFADGLRARGVQADDHLFRTLQSSGEGLDHSHVSTSRQAYVSWAEAILREVAEHGIGPDTEPFVMPALEQLHQAPMRPLPGVVDLLSALRSRGIITAVCSNWSWDLRDDLADAGIGPLIDIVGTSARIGVRKPHPAIYQRILQQAGVDAAEAVYVGDSPTADVEGPSRVGIRAVHVVAASAPSPADHRIDDIRDFRRFLAAP